jgi:hypothetical protein
MNLFDRSSMNVSARAVGALRPSTGCVFALGVSGTVMNLSGNAAVSVATCGILINADLNVNGNASLNAQSIGVVGNALISPNASVNPAPVGPIAAFSDPLAFLSAPSIPPNCLADPLLSANGSSTLLAGCYNGLTVGGNFNLRLSGTYIINGALNLGGNASLIGTDVTLILEGSTTIPANVIMNLTAPTSGPYNGIVMFQPSSNSSALSIAGNAGSTIKGVIYAPNAPVTFTGNAGATLYTDFVTKSLTLAGNASFNSYASLSGVSPPIQSARLVE